MRKLLLSLALLPSLALAATGQKAGVNSAPNLTGNGSASSVLATGSTTSRTLAARFQDALRPTDFGAVGDGTTDDRAALQAWLNAGSSTKRPLVGDGRTYRVGGTESLIIGSSTTIDGQGMTLKPDTTMNVPLFSGWGSVGTHKSNITISGIHMDGTNRPADSEGGFGAYWFGWVDHLTVRDCTWFQTHDAIYLRAVENFTISGIQVTNSNAAIVAMLSETRRGVISDIQGTLIDEVLDFYNNEDIVASNMTATGHVDPNHIDEAIDLSTSRRITIRGVVVTGFGRGVLIKTETGLADGSPSWEDLVLSDITIKDQLYDGINAQGAIATYGPAKRLRVRNVTIQSSVVGSTGVKLTPPNASTGQDATFDNLNIDTPGIGFWTYTFNGVKLRNSKIRTTAANAVLTGSGTRGGDFEMSGCDVGATGGTTSDSAVMISDWNDPRIERNAIFSTTGTALKLVSNIRPVVAGNVISSAGLYGISLTWPTGAAALDPRKLATITGNIVRDWGQAATNRQAIFLSVTGVAASLEGLDVSGNVAVLSDSAIVQNQSPLTLSLGSATLARSRYANNTAGARVPNEAGDAALFNGDGVWGNVPSPGASVYQGTGSPEGVVLAKIGSLYLQRNGGVQAHWLKTASDSAATGWKLVGSQAAARADSVSADVNGLKIDFNDLLAKLRTAGVLAP